MFEYVILGAGINGMLLSDILSFPCLGVNLGGFISSDFDAPKILHQTEIVDKYLKERKIEAELLKYKCCYLYNNIIYNNIYSDKIDLRKLYAIKTERNTNESIMSSGKNTIIGYDIKQIIDSIKNNINFIYCKINKIEYNKADLCYDIYTNNEIIKTQNIINTLPITTLNKLLDIQSLFVYKAKDIYYSLADIPDDLLKDYNYMYVIDENIPFYRITKNKDKHIIESLTSLENKTFEICGYKFECKNEMIAKKTKLINSYDTKVKFITKNTNSIINVGRNANWNHKLKMNDVIETAYSIKQWL